MKKLFFIALFVFAVSAGVARSVDLDMGVIEYSGTGALNADIDALTGSISCNNASTYTCPPFGTPGSTLITGTIGNQVTIACRKNPKLTNQNSVVLTLRKSHVGISGSKYLCAGLRNPVVTHTITGSGINDTVYWGGQLRVSNADSADLTGTFSTTGPGSAKAQRIRLIFL